MLKCLRISFTNTFPKFFFVVPGKVIQNRPPWHIFESSAHFEEVGQRTVNNRNQLSIDWWVDISLCFTQNKHYVQWQTLSQPCLTSTVRWYHGFGRFSESDRQTRFWRFSPFFHSNHNRIRWWPHPNSGRLQTYSRLGGTADSADFQSPIARPVSDDFRHFFTQIAIECSLGAGDSPYARFYHLFHSVNDFPYVSVLISALLSFVLFGKWFFE